MHKESITIEVGKMETFNFSKMTTLPLRNIIHQLACDECIDWQDGACDDASCYCDCDNCQCDCIECDNDPCDCMD
jgi:hypothetical protein